MKTTASLSRWLCASFMLIISYFSYANNLNINNVVATTNAVSFDISWDNSWNVQDLSRDAVWVFVKYQDCGTTNKSWDHLNLAASGHTIGGGLLTINTVTDNKGVFIRRAAYGGGNNPTTPVTLKFATPFANIDNVNFDAIGIEMVYVAEGSFWAGDGASGNRFGNNGTGTPRYIEDENEIPVHGLANTTSTSSGQNGHRQNRAIPAAFPKGYNGFYCMKYEITQGQYVHFLNLLPATHQSERTQVPVTSSAGTYAMYDSPTISRRNSIKIITPAAGNPMTPAIYGCDFNNNSTYNEAGDGMGIAMNYINWSDMAAYLDWAALRPMTELEYEKAVRGPLDYLGGEYAWGSTIILQTRANGLVDNLGFNNEESNVVGPGLCNISTSSSSGSILNQTGYASGNDNNGPLRTGFASSVGTSRSQAGATYYGIMEMSGNVYEQTISIGAVDTGEPVIFTGILGDGSLDDNGYANETGWGLPNEAKWVSIRGGSYASQAASARISERPDIVCTGCASRSSDRGGRGVRQY